ncbi:MAG TPA: TonB-dependent receptor plug domain-containing protein [Rhizomicrobium sp.]|nr:TonB-dependent receptor plug domain-containing protein [Rhizomicrobium sp.]
MRFLFHFLAVSLLLAILPAQAQAQAQESIETVTVTGDRAHLIETEPDDTAFGLDKPLLETPRAVTVVSDTTVDRYGVTGVDTLTAITPSAYTASFYGVEGAVNLRGTLAESYFRGFKRADNRGTYSTPLGDAAEIEILRGPPSAIYGAGKVGGLVNFVPKSVAASQDSIVSGDVAVTYGSTSKRNLAGEIGAPLDLGAVTGGIHAYGEIDDSHSFYRGLHPSHQLLELSGDFTLGNWSLSSDYMYYHSNGDVQTPGWNRLTQSLVDTGIYLTGRNTSLADADGNGRLTLNELGGNPYAFDPNFKPLYIAVPGCGNCTDATHTLDTGVGTTHLSPRTVYIAPGVDFSNTITHTGFVELARVLDNGDRVRLQGFVDTLSNDRFVSYGFPGSYRTLILETRARYDFNRTFGSISTQNVVGASYRTVQATGKESFNSGVIALDRRDISVGAMSNDIIDSPFNMDPSGAVGLGWENDIHSNTSDAGLFAVSDIAWQRLDLLLSGRYDAYNVRSVDLGVLAFEPPSGRGGKGSLTYSASLSYKTEWGLIPYVTNAKSAAIELGQASQVATSLLANDDWLSNSFLNEAGVKFAFLDQHLVGSLAWYRQERTQLEQGGGVTTVMGTRSQGGEAEVRYVMNENVSFTLAGSLQHTLVKGPDHSFAYIPARDAGVAPVNGFGGSYVTFDFSTLPGKSGNYEYALIPHAVISPYVTYTSDDQGWGATFGGSYVSHTAQTVPDPIVFPAYVLLNASAFLRWDAWEADINVNNLAGERYFTPDADTYANLAALPGQGRTWRITLKRVF